MGCSPGYRGFDPLPNSTFWGLFFFELLKANPRIFHGLEMVNVGVLCFPAPNSKTKKVETEVILEGFGCLLPQCLNKINVFWLVFPTKNDEETKKY